MRRRHSQAWSRLLWTYHEGPDHPTKLRLWGWARRMSRHALLTVPYGNGGVIALDERDWLQREVLTRGFYEPEVWEALFAFASGSEVLWDIGAHVGTFTIRGLLDSRVACVHAFEPDPESNESL